MTIPPPVTAPPAGLAFSLLGPVEIARDGVPVPVHSLKTRALLALLLLHRAQPVPLALIVERIWDDPPPPSARASAHNVVSGLRKLLGDDDHVSLTTETGGYVLDTPAESLDRTVFDVLRTRGRGLLHAGDLDTAAGCLREALALWRGPAVVDLSSSGYDWPEVGELTGAWLETVEDLIQVDLHRKRYRDVLVRLAPLLAGHPGREPLHRAKIIALHRCGRRAEAAGAYLEAHRLLSDRTGRQPSAEFHDVHRLLLAEEQTTVDSHVAPRDDWSAMTAPIGSVRRSDGGGPSLIPRIGPAEHSVELAHEVRAVAVLCARVCAPAAPASMIARIGRVVREHGGVVGDIRDTAVVSYFGLGAPEPVTDDTDPGACAVERAAVCAIALHRGSSADRVQAGDLNGEQPRSGLACAISTGPVMHIVRESGPGEATSWVASELIGLCAERAEQVRPGETAIF